MNMYLCMYVGMMRIIAPQEAVDSPCNSGFGVKILRIPFTALKAVLVSLIYCTVWSYISVPSANAEFLCQLGIRLAQGNIFYIVDRLDQ